jgi:hypothetical protein
MPPLAAAAAARYPARSRVVAPLLLAVAIAVAWPAPRDLLPPSAIPAISAALGRGDPAYRAEGLRFANARHGMTARFGAAGLRLRAGGESVGLSLAGLGRGDDVRPVARTQPRALANRIEYRHGSTTEWFVNGPAGLEHGFTLRAPPAPGSGPLTAALTLTGAPARLEPGRRGLSIGDLRYGGLWAADAGGRELPAWLELDGSRLALRVDDAGARYPLTIDPIFQAGRLTASDGAAGDVFGAAVAVSGDTVAVGARGDENGHGAVYVFVEPSTGWATATEAAKLTASDGRDGDNLGASVAIAGSTIVAGAPFDTVGDDDDRGSAYVFVRPPGGWAGGEQAAKLQVTGGTAQEAFGASVAIDGATVVVGAPQHNVGADVDQGAAYVFVRPQDGWANTVFQSAALTVASGVAQDQLGRAVAIDDDTVVAGAPGAIIGGGAPGAAFVFERPDTGWSSVPPRARLTAGDAATADHLGLAVRIAGDTIVAGAPYDDVGDASNVGSAYVFLRPRPGGRTRRTTRS